MLNLADTLGQIAGLTDTMQRARTAADQHQLYQQELQDQQTKAGLQDIMNRVALEGMGRPVQLGTVQDRMNAPDTTAGASPGAPYTPPVTTEDLQNLPTSGNPGTPYTPPVTTEDLQNLPTQGTTVPGQSYDFVRKPDQSRTVSYKDRNGQQYQYELYTPEEQAARARQRKVADIGADESAKLEADQQNRQKYGIAPQPGVNTRIGAPEGTKWLPGEWDKIAERIINTSKAPNLHFEQTVDDNGNVTINGYDDRTGELKSTSRVPGAGKSAANRNSSHIVTDDDGNVTAFTLDRNGRKVGSVDLGQIGKSRPDKEITPGQQGVQDRFNQRRLDQQKKDLAAVQKQEDDEHAYRIATGQQLATATTDADKNKYQAALKGSAFKIQAYQSRKAEILGTKAPDKATMAKIPEGSTATSPDGHQWMKKDGIVYLVK